MKNDIDRSSTKQVVVITGGAGGMGQATAKLLGRSHHCILSDVRENLLDRAKQELERNGIHCDTVVSDITSKSSVEELMAYAEQVGPIASLIHTAGVSPQMGDAAFIIKVNALGTIRVNEAFFDIAQEGASLINVASMAAHMMPSFLVSPRRYAPAFSDPEKLIRRLTRFTKWFPKKARPGLAYGISKNFVVWYSKTQARKFGQKGVRILSVSPGTFETPMGELEKKSGAYAITQYSALSRVGKVDEIAQLLAFCASSKAGYLTGTDILCDGGTVASITRLHQWRLHSGARSPHRGTESKPEANISTQ